MLQDDNRKYASMQSKIIRCFLFCLWLFEWKLIDDDEFVFRFDVMFSSQNVTLSFKLSDGLSDTHAALLSPHVKITRKSDRMEIVI